MTSQFECKVERNGGVAIVKPCGQLDSGETDRFEAVLLETLEKDKPRIVIDLEGLMFVSSSGLRVLLLAAKQTQEKKGTLLLCSLRPQIQSLLKTAGFNRLLKIRVSRQEAVAEATTGS